MNRRTRLVVAALSVAAVGFPTATAQAAPKASPASVKAHVKKAQGAQARLATMVRRGDVAGAKRVLKVARREASTASRQARTLATRAQRSDAAAEAAVGSLSVSAANIAAAIEQFAALIPKATTAIQEMIANAIPGSIAGHDQLVQTLTDLVGKLGGEVQGLAAQALALLQADSPDQVSALAETALTDLPAHISELIDAALAAASAALETGLGELAKVIPNLPEALQGPLTMALDSVKSLLSGLMPTLQQTTAAVTNIVSEVIAMVKSLVGGLLGSNGDGSETTVDADSGKGLFGGLLDGITSMLPTFGGMFGKLLGGITGR
ncbi:MAG TPA: hypothetical protein VFZ89_12810 [Solirubrobacteraceae bacterium]